MWFAGADPLQETHCLQRSAKKKKALRALRALKGRGPKPGHPPFGPYKKGAWVKRGVMHPRGTLARPPRARGVKRAKSTARPLKPSIAPQMPLSGSYSVDVGVLASPPAPSMMSMALPGPLRGPYSVDVGILASPRPIFDVYGPPRPTGRAQDARFPA